MKAPSVTPVRCAIYTRVSTDAASTNCYGTSKNATSETRNQQLSTGATRGGIPFGWLLLVSHDPNRRGRKKMTFTGPPCVPKS